MKTAGLCPLSPEASILGIWGVASPRFWAAGCGVPGVVGCRGRVVKYYILSCTRSMFESGDV